MFTVRKLHWHCLMSRADDFDGKNVAADRSGQGSLVEWDTFFSLLWSEIYN
jgi:hypothetical protein